VVGGAGGCLPHTQVLVTLTPALSLEGRGRIFNLFLSVLLFYNILFFQ
jgi:hypothetical protein